MKKKNEINRFLIFSFILSTIFIQNCNKTSEKIPLPKKVVIIVIDTLRADHLKFYNYAENTTPFLSELAKTSTVFDRCFSTSSWTAPATASIFTSLYPFQHRVETNMLANWKFNEKLKKDYKIKLNRIPEKITTLGEIFKINGYATFGFADNINIGKKEGFDQGFDHMETYNYKNAEFINDRIKRVQKKIAAQDKYLMFIQYMDPHQPKHYRKRWFKTRQLKDKLKKEGSEKEDFEIEKNNAKLYYDSEIDYVDQKIEELYRLFNWDKDTLLIVTSDHGEEFWDHGKFGHGYSHYKEVIHVPLMIRYPEANFKSGHIKQNVSIIDILPTLRDLLRFGNDKMNEGISLKKFLEKGERESKNDRYLYSHLLKRVLIDGKIKKIESFSTINDQWHYINDWSGDGETFNEKLFNLMEDFSQKNNLFGKFKTTQKRLRASYIKFFRSCTKFIPSYIDYKSNKKEMDRLKTLGYIE